MINDLIEIRNCIEKGHGFVEIIVGLVISALISILLLIAYFA